MKNLSVLASALIILSFAHCKTKQKAAETPTPPVPLSTTAGKSLGELQMEIANARWPNTVTEEIKEGQVIYTTKCTKCHKNFEIERFGEKKWLHEIDDMSPKAKLTPEEKLRLTKYILSYRETKERAKAN